MANVGILVVSLMTLLWVAVANMDDAYHRTENLLGLRRPKEARAAEEKYTPPAEKETSFWIKQAQDEVKKRMHVRENLNKAKNIIFFLGDGMSISTITAARILKGQRYGNTGEEDSLSFEKFPHSALSKTYCTNGQVADSACTATAYLCGVKTNVMLIGVNAHVGFNDCNASSNAANRVESIASWAQKAGKSTGIVTTTRVTHASPSGAYAHVANRMWESDSDVASYGVNTTICSDIATQLITQLPGKNFNVIMGGGRSKLLPETTVDMSGAKGQRLDGVNLISQWQADHPQGAYVTNRNDLLNLNYTATKDVLGLFHYSDLDYHMTANNSIQPTLRDMTESAIRILRKNPNGYFIFIEGGRIDHGHHETKPGLSLDETLEFDKAIERAVKLTNSRDTLIVVSSDHAHTMSIAGYPGRGNNILGLNEYDVDLNGVPYATLNYAVGSEQYLDKNGNRIDLTGKLNEESHFPSYIKGIVGTHAGDDVGVFASGPYSHLFRGVMQQNIIPHLLAYASCIGGGSTLCQTKPVQVKPTKNPPKNFV